MKHPQSILIVAGDTDGNLGDRAIVLSMCDAFRKLRPDIEIAILSGNPERDQQSFPGITLIARGPQGLWSLIRQAWKSDLVLCGGGGLFQDDDSLVKMPYWAARLMLLRCLCRRIVGYAIGAGPLRSRLGRLSARLAFACMEIITVRDRQAQASCEGLTRKPIELLPDPALLTSGHSGAAAFLEQSLTQMGIHNDGTPIVGVSLRRWFHHRKNAWIPHKYVHKYRLRSTADNKDYRHLTTLIARALDRLISTSGARLVFMPTYNVPHESDNETCRAVIEKMRHRDRTALLEIDDPCHYKGVSNQLAVMLGGRMHPTILAASTGTPIVGLSYNQKFQGFFDLLGIGERTLNIETFVRQDQTDQLVSLLADGIQNGRTTRNSRIDQLTAEIHAFNQRLLLPERETTPCRDSATGSGVTP